ncbi:MAG TPA: pantoate--beta-alanine ligase, partial [Lacipirellulaceae bacterium]|nr:pantoate--beta-alanine ligase [Lacipirellulaceae bacterium]
MQRTTPQAAPHVRRDPNDRGQLGVQLLTDGEALRQTVINAKRAGKSVGLIPTMGALHEGHLSLLETARTECDLTVVSVYVNPTQFAPQEDFRSYPRDLDHDLELLGRGGCDIVFIPTDETMYATNHTTFVDVGPLGQALEGEHRPTHFRGVATVVLKLFQLAPADRAYFGRKDYQQTVVVRQMVTDLNVPV